MRCCNYKVQPRRKLASKPVALPGGLISVGRFFISKLNYSAAGCGWLHSGTICCSNLTLREKTNKHNPQRVQLFLSFSCCFIQSQRKKAENNNGQSWEERFESGTNIYWKTGLAVLLIQSISCMYCFQTYCSAMLHILLNIIHKGCMEGHCCKKEFTSQAAGQGCDIFGNSKTKNWNWKCLQTEETTWGPGAPYPPSTDKINRKIT